MDNVYAARDIWALILNRLTKRQQALLQQEIFRLRLSVSYQNLFRFMAKITKNKEVLVLAEKGQNLYNDSFAVNNDRSV